MLIENFLQISTITSMRTSDLHSHRPFHFKEKRYFTITLNGQRLCSSSLPSWYRPYIRPIINLGSRIVCNAHEAFHAVQTVTDCSWNERVIASDNLVLVDFWDPRNGPCRMLDELVKGYDRRIEFYKMNIDDYPNISKQLQIKSLPAMLLFKDGEMKESIIGVVSKSALQATIEKYLDG